MARRVAYALAALALLPAAASAQGRVCAPTDQIVDRLAEQFGEHLTAAGVDGNGNMVSVYSSEDGTWTLAVTLPGGVACVVSSGEGWSYERPEPQPQPQPQPKGRPS